MLGHTTKGNKSTLQHWLYLPEMRGHQMGRSDMNRVGSLVVSGYQILASVVAYTPQLEKSVCILQHMSTHHYSNNITVRGNVFTWTASPEVFSTHAEWYHTLHMKNSIQRTVHASSNYHNNSNAIPTTTFNSSMIKNMLKRRKLSDTYLDTFRRHRWSAQMTI